MRFVQLKSQKTLLALTSVLLLEVALVLLLRGLGWYGTGNAVVYAACLVVTLLPLLVASVLLLRKRFQFSLRALFAVTTLVAVFLMVSLMPLVNHRSARQASMRMLSADGSINEPSWNEFYSEIILESQPNPGPGEAVDVPPWLAPFVGETRAIPADRTVFSIWLNNDEQCQILADEWERFPMLRSVSVMPGVSDDGFRVLQDVLPRLEQLESVHTNDVPAPPDWYGSLKNVRVLWVWGEGNYRGSPFPREHLTDIASLPKLKGFMVLGFAFDDADARELARSASIEHVILRRTLVTAVGESVLRDDAIRRVVYRN